MKQKVVLCAGLLALMICGSASAQPLPYPAGGYPGYGPGLLPHEVLTIVRSLGLEPLTRPLRTGPAYALRALDPAGQELRVVIDARVGRVVGVVPVGPRHALTPPPYGQPVARLVPDGYGPSSRITGLVPGGRPIDAPPNVPLTGGMPIPPALGASAPPHASAQVGPPLPRPRPKLAAATPPVSSKPAPVEAAPNGAPSPSAAPAASKATTSAAAPPASSTAPIELDE